MNVRIVFQEVSQPGRKISIAQHERHCAATRLFGDLQVVQIGYVNFGYVVGERPQFFHQPLHAPHPNAALFLVLAAHHSS